MKGQEQIIAALVWILLLPFFYGLIDMATGQCYQQGYNDAKKQFEAKLAAKGSEIQKLQGQIKLLESELNQWKQRYASLNKEYNRLITEKVTKYDVARILNEVNAVNYRVELLKLEVNNINNIVNQYDSIVMQMNVELKQTITKYHISLAITGLTLAALSADAINIAINKEPKAAGTLAKLLKLIITKVLGFISSIRNIHRKRKKNGGGKDGSA